MPPETVLWHNFHNIIFKIKHKLYTASGSASLPPIPLKIVHVRLTLINTKCNQMDSTPSEPQLSNLSIISAVQN